MGVVRDGGRDDKPKRKTKTVAGALAGLFPDKQQTGETDWGDCMPEMLASVVVAVTRAGGLISFGRSRDLGALSITIILDNDKRTTWVPVGTDIESELERIIHFMDALPR